MNLPLFRFPVKKILFYFIFISICVFCIYLWQISYANQMILEGNEGAHTNLLYSITFNQRLDFYSIDQHALGDHSYYKGKAYSNKPPGFPILISPFYYLYTKISPPQPELKYHQTLTVLKITSALFSALTIGIIFLFYCTYEISIKSIIFGLISSAFGTLSYTYGSTATSHPLSIFLILGAVFFLRLFHLNLKQDIFFGVFLFLCSYSLLVDTKNVFFIVAFIPFLLMDFIKIGVEKPFRFLAFSIPALFPLVILFIYNYYIFGNPFESSYSYYVPPPYLSWESPFSMFSLTNIPRGFFGLTLSPSRGLFLISPIVLFGFIASIDAIRRKKRDLSIVFSVVIVGILIVSSYRLWHGGHCLGYRHILTSAVLLSMLSAFFIEYYGNKWRLLPYFALAISCLSAFLGFFMQLVPGLLAYTWKAEPDDVHASFYTELLIPFIQMWLRSGS